MKILSIFIVGLLAAVPFSFAAKPAAPQQAQTHWFGYTFSNADNSPVVAGTAYQLPLPTGCTKLTEWDARINLPGTAGFDVWRTPYGGNPTSANSITNGNSPAITSGYQSYSSNLSTWQYATQAHDVYVLYVSYITGGATQATLELSCQ